MVLSIYYMTTYWQLLLCQYFSYFLKSSIGVIVCKVGGRYHLYKDVDKIGYLCKILYTWDMCLYSVTFYICFIHSEMKINELWVIQSSLKTKKYITQICFSIILCVFIPLILRNMQSSIIIIRCINIWISSLPY